MFSAGSYMSKVFAFCSKFTRSQDQVPFYEFSLKVVDVQAFSTSSNLITKQMKMTGGLFLEGKAVLVEL